MQERKKSFNYTVYMITFEFLYLSLLFKLHTILRVKPTLMYRKFLKRKFKTFNSVRHFSEYFVEFNILLKGIINLFLLSKLIESNISYLHLKYTFYAIQCLKNIII